MDTSKTIVCFGDSNTWGYDPRDKFGDHYHPRWTDLLADRTGWTVINEGVNGREVPHSPGAPDAETDLFLVMLGTNDLLQLDTPEAAAERMEVFLSGMDSEKVVLIAPPPMISGEWVQDEELIQDSIRLGTLYEALADRLGIRFLNAGTWDVPLAFDGVHFTQEGQRVFAENLAKELMI